MELLAGTDKQVAFNALQRMPESATLDEISEELAILAAIRRGETAADAGRTLTHDEVKQRSASWTGK
jgi:predicted transcriptional regulator